MLLQNKKGIKAKKSNPSTLRIITIAQTRHYSQTENKKRIKPDFLSEEKLLSSMAFERDTVAWEGKDYRLCGDISRENENIKHWL